MECDEGTSSSCEASGEKKEIESLTSPVCLIVLGMAGSGKTTFVSKLDSYLKQHKRSPYLVNLDPACKNMPYKPNIGRYENLQNFKFIIVVIDVYIYFCFE